MRKRSEVGPGPVKASAEARTVPLPGVAEATGIKCGECGVQSALSALTVRDDGDHECANCGAVVELDAPTAASAKRARDDIAQCVSESKQPQAKPTKTSTKDTSSTRVELPQEGPLWCAKCATRITVAAGKPGEPDHLWWPCGHKSAGTVGEPDHLWWPCGHKSAGTVDHPSKAEQIKPAAGTQMVDVQPRGNSSGPVTKIVDGATGTPRRIHVEWGESAFRVADYSTFRVGPYAITHDLFPGQDPEVAAEEAHVKMHAMADADFDRKLAWFLDKMETIKREKAKRGSRE